MELHQTQQALANVDCEVRTDVITRQLYATDASIYQVEPQAVALPRGAGQAASVMGAAADAGIPITLRGAGTGLTGAAIGEGLVIDLARYNRTISEFDPEGRTIRVEPGVVLDQLNAFLAPHGLCFGPDVATSSRATLGGMIGNNSSGARAPIYGTTIDQVLSLDAVLADGSIHTVSAEACSLDEDLKRQVDALIMGHADAIRERCPEGLVKRWPGYGLDRYLKAPGDLCKVIGASEGTLAAVTGATLRLAPLPSRKALAILFFGHVDEAMETTVHLLDLKPAAIEHVDRLLFDQTKGQMPFKAARELLELDAKPCESFLIVEFYEDENLGDVEDKLAELARRKLGMRSMTCTDAADMLKVWALRKAGLNLLTGRKGPSKPIAGLEDVAVRPDQVADYVKALGKVVDEIGLATSFYGHAASGLVHVRPLVDLHRADDTARFRKMAEEVSALTRQFKGSLAGEHGVGMARTEFMEEHLGNELLGVMRDIKALFDPKGLMNPGKIFGGKGFRIDSHLRWGDGYAIPTPFEPMAGFVTKDGSLVANLEQCNGCGQCRKDEPTMCPTYLATGEEMMSTRGRANIIRAVLDGRIQDASDPLVSQALDEALSNCLSCKACKTECPSNVNMALLKAELMHARHRKHGVPLLERFVSRFDLVGQLGCTAPALANTALGIGWLRRLMERFLGLAADRPLPAYAGERFDTWFGKRNGKAAGSRGRVYLWDDCSVRYCETSIGRAAVKVLEAAGFEVVLAEGHQCCGRPAFSVGRLDTAKRFGLHNVKLFTEQYVDGPIVFLEPSCYSMFAGDYAELGVPGAEAVAERCQLFEQFVFDLVASEPDALPLKPLTQAVGIHGHCHAKALTNVDIMPKLAQCATSGQVRFLQTGCCGMAGSFGALRDKYELSVAVAEPLVRQVEALPGGSRVVASGTSCRQQIDHLTEAEPVHMAELLAEALDSGSV